MIGEGEGGDIGGEGEGVVGDAPDASADNKAKSDARGDAPEGGRKIDLGDAPLPVQQALDGGEDEEYFESEKWPGMIEARWTDPDTDETYVVAVADPEGNAVGDASGGPGYVIYSADDGSVSGPEGGGRYETLDEAVADLPGNFNPEDDASEDVAIDAMDDDTLLAEIREGNASPGMIAAAEERGLLEGEDPGDAEGSRPPEGVSQGVWDAMTPEERDAASSGIAEGLPPDEAVRRATTDPENEPYEQGDEPEGVGSAQQQAGTKVMESASLLESTLFDEAESGALTDEQYDTIGRELEGLMRKMDTLNTNIQDGNYNAGDLAAAQDALAGFEALLMQTADGPGWSDEQANEIGQALDNLFADLGDLASSLQGETEPPPFAARRYVRQWLGRRGIRLGRKPTIMV
jgi:hypothetical protein